MNKYLLLIALIIPLKISANTPVNGCEIFNTAEVISLNGICFIKNGIELRYLDYDKVLLEYNEFFRENQLVLIKNKKIALLINHDLFYILENGNEGIGDLFTWLGSKAAVWGAKQAQKMGMDTGTEQPDGRSYETSEGNDGNNRKDTEKSEAPKTKPKNDNSNAN